MVQFGATLEAQRNKGWEQYYIDYNVSETTTTVVLLTVVC